MNKEEKFKNWFKGYGKQVKTEKEYSISISLTGTPEEAQYIEKVISKLAKLENKTGTEILRDYINSQLAQNNIQIEIELEERIIKAEKLMDLFNQKYQKYKNTKYFSLKRVEEKKLCMELVGQYSLEELDEALDVFFEIYVNEGKWWNVYSITTFYMSINLLMEKANNPIRRKYRELRKEIEEQEKEKNNNYQDNQQNLSLTEKEEEITTSPPPFNNKKEEEEEEEEEYKGVGEGVGVGGEEVTPPSSPFNNKINNKNKIINNEEEINNKNKKELTSPSPPSIEKNNNKEVGGEEITPSPNNKRKLEEFKEDLSPKTNNNTPLPEEINTPEKFINFLKRKQLGDPPLFKTYLHYLKLSLGTQYKDPQDIEKDETFNQDCLEHFWKYFSQQKGVEEILKEFKNLQNGRKKIIHNKGSK